MRAALLGALLLASLAAAPSPSGPPAEPPPPPSTPREFFNAGTQKLLEGKLREAEAFLESALTAQKAALQPPALYNLGHVRFLQGAEELKKGPAAQPTAARGQTASRAAADAVRSADQALAENDIQKMVAAYLRGRGVRRELNAATRAMKQALQAHGAALRKWQRSSGDFKSTLELHPADADAEQNADTVDRCIAKLVDRLEQLQMLANALGQQRQELGDKLKQLKGRIPAPDMPPGAAGDEEEEEDMPNGPKPGQQESPSRDGEEMSVSPEQAGWLLEGFRLDSERRLPMGQPSNNNDEQRNRSRATW